jgi:hypothetical protein
MANEAEAEAEAEAEERFLHNAFTGSEREERRRLAPVGMTGVGTLSKN